MNNDPSHFPFLPEMGRHVRMEASWLRAKDRRVLASNLAIQYLFCAHRSDEEIAQVIERTVDRYLAAHPAALLAQSGAGL